MRTEQTYLERQTSIKLVRKIWWDECQALLSFTSKKCICPYQFLYECFIIVRYHPSLCEKTKSSYFGGDSVAVAIRTIKVLPVFKHFLLQSPANSSWTSCLPFFNFSIYVILDVFMYWKYVKGNLEKDLNNYFFSCQFEKKMTEETQIYIFKKKFMELA